MFAKLKNICSFALAIGHKRSTANKMKRLDRLYFASLAQLVEHLTCNEAVIRSSRIGGSLKR